MFLFCLRVISWQVTGYLLVGDTVLVVWEISLFTTHHEKTDEYYLVVIRIFHLAAGVMRVSTTLRAAMNPKLRYTSQKRLCHRFRAPALVARPRQLVCLLRSAPTRCRRSARGRPTPGPHESVGGRRLGRRVPRAA